MLNQTSQPFEIEIFNLLGFYLSHSENILKEVVGKIFNSVTHYSHIDEIKKKIH